jgi:cytochrome P450
VQQGLAPLPDDALVAELGNMLFAATDTTGNTLTYRLFELARYPARHARLRYWDMAYKPFLSGDLSKAKDDEL